MLNQSSISIGKYLLMKKLTRFTFLLFFVCNSAFSQVDSLRAKIFNNDSIRFELRFYTVSATTQKKHPVSSHRIIVEMSTRLRQVLFEKDSLFWVTHLSDSTSDWATNLILYDLYKKDAMQFVYFKDRERWLSIKNEEINYWKETLK